MNLHDKKLTETIKTELKEYIGDRLEDYDTETINKLIEDNELHHELFNTDYYIDYYFEAKEWLNKHKIHPFDAITIIRNYELDNFGGDSLEIVTKYMRENADYKYFEIVNMLAYIVGEELINELMEVADQHKTKSIHNIYYNNFV
tara:strand:+ start:137 stop:571 length:435 start_codon:yes stop_codon:yes gene_type:complete